MRKSPLAVIVGLLAVGAWACVVTIEAQTLPVTLTAQWSPNPTADNVVTYALTLDTGTPIVVQASTCTPTVCSTPFVVTTTGSHTLSLIASSSIADSVPTTLAFNLTVTKPGAIQIHK